MRIFMFFLLLSLVQQKYEVEFLLQQQWIDPRLKYANQSSYEFLNAIHHNDKMWLPDTYFIMHGDFKDNPIIPMHFALRIHRNGTINYLMRQIESPNKRLLITLKAIELHVIRRRHLILSCQGSLNIFPFDDPLCSFSVESSEYFSLSIILLPQFRKQRRESKALVEVHSDETQESH